MSLHTPSRLSSQAWLGIRLGWLHLRPGWLGPRPDWMALKGVRTYAQTNDKGQNFKFFGLHNYTYISYTVGEKEGFRLIIGEERKVKLLS